jgi:hypothetical protein
MNRKEPPSEPATLVRMRAHRLRLRRVTLWLLAINLTLFALRIGIEQHALYWSG